MRYFTVLVVVLLAACSSVVEGTGECTNGVIRCTEDKSAVATCRDDKWQLLPCAPTTCTEKDGAAACLDDGITDIDVCEGITCSSHGQCTAVHGQAQCSCDEGFSASGLECIVTPDSCNGITCSNHGQCTVVDGPAQCNCDEGYSASGLECIVTPDSCDGITCSSHGQCAVVDGQAQCNCDEGYHANGLECLVIPDPCDGITCSAHGQCTAVNGQAQCNCDEGYIPSGLTCVADAPDYCSDGLQNNGETGIDCGGDCLHACPAGTTYYISNDGDDNNAGTSPDQAWATIGKVNGFDADPGFQPGDWIRFRRGDVWRGTPLVITSSGAEGAWLIIGAYGTDPAKPKIFASQRVASWEPVTAQDVEDFSPGLDVSNLWKSSNTFSIFQIIGRNDANIFFEDLNGNVTWGYLEAREENPTWPWNAPNPHFDHLNTKQDYTYVYDSRSSSANYQMESPIYIYSEQNPNHVYRNVEVPQARGAVGIGDFFLDQGEHPPSYVIVEELDARYGHARGIDAGGYKSAGDGPTVAHHLIIRNCHVGYVGRKGDQNGFGVRARHSEMQIVNNVIHDSGRRNLAVDVFDTEAPMTMRNVVIEGNHFYNGFHTTGIDLSNENYSTFENIVIRNNFFEGSVQRSIPRDGMTDYEDGLSSNHIYTDNRPDGGDHTGILRNVFVYNNIFTHLYGKGANFNETENNLLAFNTFYGSTRDYDFFQGHIYLTGALHTDVRNNITYNNDQIEHRVNQYGNIAIVNNTDNLMTIRLSQATEFYTFDYNLHHVTEDDILFYSGRRFTEPNGSTYYSNDSYIAIACQSSSKLCEPDQSPDANFDDYRAWTGLDMHSPYPADPLFLDGANDDFRVNAASPAVGAGDSIFADLITTDFYGNDRDAAAPTVGAVEYSATFNGQSGLPKVPDLVYDATHRSKLPTIAQLVAALGTLGGEGPTPPEKISATVTASAEEAENPAIHAYDDDTATRWSAEFDQWIQFQFAEQHTLEGVTILFYQGDQRVYTFDVEYSTDSGSTWLPIITEGSSSGATSGAETFAFDTPVSTALMRINAHGNNVNDWNSYNEIDWLIQ